MDRSPSGFSVGQARSQSEYRAGRAPGTVAACSLVLYARVPEKGAVKTRLQPFLDPDESLALHRALLEDSVRLLRLVAERVGVRPVLSFSEDRDPRPSLDDCLAVVCEGIERMPQRLGDLGERLAGTLEDLEAAGGTGAVIFGSDSPTLPPEWLESACESIAAGTPIVIGPARDGGYYLIGTRLPAPSLFDGVPWGSDAVLGETLRRARRAGLPASLLPPWYDVDRPEDLERADRDLTRTGGFAPDRTAAFLLRLRQSGRLS